MTTEEETRTTKGKRVRLTLEITPELQQRIQRAAAEHNQTVQGYAEEMLEQAVPAEHGAATRPKTESVVRSEDLDPFQAVRESILKTTYGRLLDDSVEEIRRMREERTLHLESL